MPVCTDSRFYCAHHSSTYRTNTSVLIFCLIDNITSFSINKHLFRIHLMLGKIFHINFAEVTQSGMHCHISEIYSLDFHTFHQLTAKMKSCRRSCYRTFIFSKNGLETFCIFFFYRTTDETGQRSLTQSIKSFLELIVRTVIKESQSTSARSGIINNFGHHRVVITKIQLITNTDLTCRIYQYIPQAKLLIQFTQQKNLDTCTGFLFISIQTRREDFRIIKDKHIFIIKILQDILEYLVLDLAC